MAIQVSSDTVSDIAKKVDYSDYIILGFVALATVAWFTKGKLWSVSKREVSVVPATTKLSASRSIVQKMRDSLANAQQNKNAVVFYGSQTGTAEDYATRLAKEGHQKYGLRTMTADMEDYDYDNLDEFPDDSVAIFVVATYGEGEPTDNSTAFFEFIQDENSIFSEGKTVDEKPLESMQYVAFGLGNKTYEHYNAMVKICDRALTKLGATALTDYGMGDDGDGTMEEDFITWKDAMWSALALRLGLEEREATYEASFSVMEDAELTPDSASVFLGEPSKKHLTKAAKPFNANNPYFGPIASSKELFQTRDRNCLHLEIDLAGSGLKYKTGDHVAVWPTNPDQEVDRLLAALGLVTKRDVVFRLKAQDSTSKIPVPQPTTYDACLRYYLEICGPVSRQLMGTLAQFAPSEQVKFEVTRLAQDKDYFHSKVSRPHLNLAQMLQMISGAPWPIPFSVILESCGKLQPRYYSISSSSIVNPAVVSITAIVESKKFEDHQNVLNGVTTNYLLALSRKKNGESDPHPYGLSYNIAGPREKYADIKVPIHIRQSNFKLPADSSLPVVMVGPGTGVAPFRAFIQERAHQAQNGMQIGKTLLFYGCRNESEDFLYKDEWKQYKEILGDALEIDLAFSRQGPEKVYVQHRLAKRGAEVRSMLETGTFYLCGDAAHMARDVNNELIKLLGEETVKKMRSSQRHQEDVWS
ncbi:putative NADPH cytochrome P450 reductase [Taphrina deformans PYCC 5710]|uniref:NADPH--cytochrome P450 reductase n=1 Tax=Taphrina deformans (strain PYCC 5710 / ATCC 11124 / CBS 356.35 / IMI 108563 / JCM 9778 / NBRC 8474) TaxID=1097556 RepID=R4X7D5_TAPDE|nr:putative NADPH cytochrome P450 reductase [Taphrina deformans PYCC 5710]|eukprot:CCG81241.1 putative NADPH cytochrome P450 reductase [Taphrina deformans PYCC 5710]